MEYLVELRFEEKNYNAIVHFLTIFQAVNESDAQELYTELLSGFKRKEVLIFASSCRRIDIDPVLKERSYEYCEFFKRISTASIEIEQFVLDNPNQTKSLVENLIDKFFNGKNSTAIVGKRHNIPVRVLDKDSKNPISGELFYFAIEHLISNK